MVREGVLGRGKGGYTVSFLFPEWSWTKHILVALSLTAVAVVLGVIVTVTFGKVSCLVVMA